MSGVLAPLSALPGPHGIGDLGPVARRFVDLLVEAGQSIWQILPTTQPGNRSNSPYDCHSPYAFNRWLISIDELVADGMLTPNEAFSCRPARLDRAVVDYGAMQQWKGPLLERAADVLLRRAEGDATLRSDFERFQRENAHWLDDYLSFMHLKARHAKADLCSRREWPLADRCAFTATLPPERTPGMWRLAAEQYLAARQWQRLRDYAAERGIAFMTDMPFYEGDDSVTVWKRPELFDLDADLRAMRVGGAPAKPTAPQQVWGTPAYHCGRLAELIEHFAGRVAHEVARVGPGGYVRLDHVLGAVEPFLVPVYPDGTQGEGAFEPLFPPEQWNEMLRRFADVTFVGEDRGQMTPLREQLVATLEGPRIRLGIKVLSDDEPLPTHPHFADSVEGGDALYTGSTHDDPFLRTFLADNWEKATVRELAAILHDRGYASDPDDLEQVAQGYMQIGFDSRARLAVVHVFDALGMGGPGGDPHERQFNVPGTVNDTNWATRIPSWALEPGAGAAQLVTRLRSLAEHGGRLAPPSVSGSRSSTRRPPQP